MKLVSHFANNRIQLVSVLTTCWSPLAGAPEGVIEEVKGVLGGSVEDDIDDPQSALEVSNLIFSRSVSLGGVEGAV